MVCAACVFMYPNGALANSRDIPCFLPYWALGSPQTCTEELVGQWMMDGIKTSHHLKASKIYVEDLPPLHVYCCLTKAATQRHI